MIKSYKREFLSYSLKTDLVKVKNAIRTAKSYHQNGNKVKENN